ncbi:MAG: glycosyltransferase, partial [Chloroflexi bacterium]|nr:glycosyltransferase [Chloroflexota bacterium]
PDYKIVIAGPDEGQYLRRLLSLRKKYHIEDTVIFPGLVTGEIKQALLQKASIFLLTSFSEGMPGAVIEAMAYGLPVIITLGCHLPIIDQAKAGMIVRPNIHEVIKAVRFLLENAEARQQMGINAKNLVKTEFDEHKIAQDFINFCESVINKNKKN